jgi:hypothetical protein
MTDARLSARGVSTRQSGWSIIVVKISQKPDRREIVS